DDQRHLPIARAVEDKRDLALARLLDLGDMTIVGRMAWAVFLERLHGKDNVLDSDRFAVMVPCGVAQTKRGRCKVARMADSFGDQAVLGRYFVERGYQQGVGECPSAQRERSLHPGYD